MLTIQLDPPSLLPPLFKSTPNTEALAVVLNVLAVLLQAALNLFSQPGAMQDVSFSGRVALSYVLMSCVAES